MASCQSVISKFRYIYLPHNLHVEQKKGRDQRHVLQFFNEILPAAIVERSSRTAEMASRYESLQERNFFTTLC